MNKLLVILILFSLISCTRNFEEINTNPNQPTDVQPNLLLRQVLYNYGEEMTYEGFVAGNLLSQHFAMVDFNLFDRHSLRDPQLGGNPWPVIYSNLRDNEILLKQARNEAESQVYLGPALILKAYMIASLTDIYGDVPFSEALQGDEGLVKPKYDGQEDIYMNENGIFDLLDRAVEEIDNYSGVFTLEGDIIYSGNLAQWKRMANSLKIKYMMRVSDKIDKSAEIQAIYDSGDYIAETSDDAKFSFTDGRPNSFRMQQLREGDFNLYIMSETMEEILLETGDPRISLWFRPIANGSGTENYKGYINGFDASQTSISLADYSLGGSVFRENTGSLNAPYISAFETYFLLAEAAQKGLINASAKALYESGIQESFAYWNTPMPDQYFETGSIEFGATGQDELNQIMTQKYLANIINGYESWIEFRRTGFPVLKSVESSLNGDLFPVRMPYPTEEEALNSENFLEVTKDNANSINSPVWWDTE